MEKDRENVLKVLVPAINLENYEGVEYFEIPLTKDQEQDVMRIIGTYVKDDNNKRDTISFTLNNVPPEYTMLSDGQLYTLQKIHRLYLSENPNKE